MDDTPPKKNGRPPTFSDKRTRKLFITAMQAGLGKRGACKCLGIDIKTVRRACLDDPTLAAEIEHARKRGKVAALAKINNSKDWRAAAWYLERVHYQEFARKQPDVVTREQLNAALASVVALLFAGQVPRSEGEALAKIQGHLTEPGSNPIHEVPPPDPAS